MTTTLIVTTVIALFLVVLIVRNMILTQEEEDAKRAESIAPVYEEKFLRTPDWVKNAVIYQVNVRQFTLEGTFNAFA